MLYLIDGSSAPLDTVQKLGEAMWKYAVTHEGGGQEFPRWEYEFPWYASGAVWLTPPWQSGMAQGTVMELFTGLYRRTAARCGETALKRYLGPSKYRWTMGELFSRIRHTAIGGKSTIQGSWSGTDQLRRYSCWVTMRARFLTLPR